MPRGRKGNTSRGRKSTTGRSRGGNRSQNEATFHEIERSGNSEEGKMGER